MPDFNQLTERQREIFDFIKGKIETRGYGPSVREIGLAFEIRSPNGVMCHLKALETKKLIKREGFSARAIQIEPTARIESLRADKAECVTALEQILRERTALQTENAQLRGENAAQKAESDQLREQLYCAKRDLEITRIENREIADRKLCYNCQREYGAW